MEENRDSMPRELALSAPRPRERTVGSAGGGRGPTMASRGSESESRVFERRLLFSGSRVWRDEGRGERDRSRLRWVLCRGDLERDRDGELEYDLCILRLR